MRGRGVWALVVLLGLVAMLVAGQMLTAGGSAPEAAQPVPKVRPAVSLGVTTQAFAANAYRPWRKKDLREINRFEGQAKRHVDTVMWFADWRHSCFEPAQAAAIAARGSVAEISWEPWDASIGAHRPQAKYRLATIIRGRHDRYIRRFARSVAGYGKPLRIRFAQEMNGRWYPWAEHYNGNRKGEFVRAWRHVHKIFDRAGAKNVTWVWTPVTTRINRRYYPGDRYVDVVGLSGFNGGTSTFRHKWRSFHAVFKQGLADLQRRFPRKPIEIAETGSAERGGNKGAWIRAMFRTIRRTPAIRSVTWFNLNKETDWRISSSRRAQKAFAAGARTLP